MWLQNSIKRKIVATVGVCFLGTIFFIAGYCIYTMHSIITQEKDDAYSLQLQTIHASLQKRFDKLVSSGMAELYEKKYQQSQIDELSDAYYQEGITSYPFIVDSNHYVVMHPTLSTDSHAFQMSESFKELMSQGHGQGSFSLEDRKYWAVFKRFEPWDWTVVYSIAKQDKYRAVNVFMRTMITILLVVIAVTGLIMYNLIRKLMAPLATMATVMQEIATGDLTRRVKVAGHDEMRQLADHFNAMVHNLKEILANAQSVARQVTDSGQEIHLVSEKQANGAAEQAQAVSETAAAAAELSKASEHIGEHIQAISHMAERILGGMSKIKTTTDQTNQILVSLNEKSKQIGTITKLIDNVADQTNLLAVNAAIEAARAGEQGRGFTVVADQIGKLADSTGKSTKDITALVELIQHEMSSATLAMEKSIAEVDEEIELTKESAATSQEIAASVSQQIRGSQQIAHSMADIEATMQDMVDGAQRSALAADNLNTLSNALKQSIVQFKADGESIEPAVGVAENDA
ncbi:methyl-accepting chemotaxis protein [Planctomycetota bacterium]